MINDVDDTLKELLATKTPLDPGAIEITFERPDKQWSAGVSKPTVNLFLYDVRENHELRDQQRFVTRNGDAGAETPPPVRVDLTYVITAWTSEVSDEHQLLGRILTTLPSARLACINVLKQSRLTIDFDLDEHGHNKKITRLVALKHWAEPLKLDSNRITAHVLASMDPAAAIVEFARLNHVDHILIGARQDSLMRSLLGSVSAKVAAEAGCTVTIARAARPAPH